MSRRSSWLTLGLLATTLLAVFVYRWWTRPPALEFDNLRYIQLLTTAVSARNPEWLTGVSRAVEQRHAAGEMTETELAALQQIIAIAQAGDWSAADRECYDLAAAQLSRRRAEPATIGHAHDH